MELLEQTFLYKPPQAAFSNIVPLSFYRGDSGNTIGQHLVKIDFFRLCILRTTVVTELKV